MTQQSLEDFIHVVLMTDDYTTDTRNIGRRTYRRGLHYRSTLNQVEELIAAGVADKIDCRYAPRCSRPEFAPIRVVPKETRWYTSSGVDTHYLTAGKVTVVPSNLAAFLCDADRAVLAA